MRDTIGPLTGSVGEVWSPLAMKFAFSTVACQDWTLDKVADAAEKLGVQGVELRTFGYGSTASACDPALTAPAKVQTTLRAAGAAPAILATSVRFDDVVFPPVIGWAITDVNRTAREGKAMVELAADIGCPLVRVFGFEYPTRERRVDAIERIVSRLYQVADAGRARGVKVVVENGGSFSTAAELAELLDVLEHPYAGAMYNVAVAAAAGDSMPNGINALGDRLLAVKVKDFAQGHAVALGKGNAPVREALNELRARKFAGWVSYELDRQWLGGSADPMHVLQHSVEKMYEWGAEPAFAAR